jgi:hypothetical protein
VGIGRSFRIADVADGLVCSVSEESIEKFRGLYRPRLTSVVLSEAKGEKDEKLEKSFTPSWFVAERTV